MIVSRLKVGEEALCRACGNISPVPKTAIETSETVDYSKGIAATAATEAAALPPLPLAGKKAWSPKGIHWLGWFFSPLPAGITWALNYERLGQPEKKMGAFLVAVFLFSIEVALSFVPDMPRFVMILMNGGSAALYYHTQKNLFKEFVAKGGSKSSFKLPIVNACAFVLLLFGVGVAIASHQEYQLRQRVQEIAKLLDTESYMIAKDRLLTLREDYPDELFPYEGLAYVFLIEERYDSSLANENRALGIDPSDSLTITLRYLTISYLREGRHQYDSAITSLDCYLQRFPDDTIQVERRAYLNAMADSAAP